MSSKSSGEKNEEESSNSATDTCVTDSSNNMTEYCKKLEAWLSKAYYQRALATSAYFTALNTYYGNSGGGGPIPNGSLNNNNYYGPSPPQLDPQQQQQQGRDANSRPMPRPAAQQQQQGPAGQEQQQRQAQIIFAGFAARGLQGLLQSGTPGVGVLVKIAPVWKRLLAECIDFVILLLVKLFVTFTIIDSFDLIDLDNIDLDALRNEAAGNGDGDSTSNIYDIAFSLTSELILLELTHRVVVCFFEGYCLWKGGGTPGKTILGLRVIHAEDVLPYVPPRNINNNNNPQLPPAFWDQSGQTVIVRPGCFLTFKRAFFRSALKNFSLAFFFPLCFTLFHFDYSRTAYDLMAKSIVIEI